MGTVSVLLMMAAAGITYGWQPDTNGGVEYVIQIPPDQLYEIERVGEISSVIDPEVQGHVSRVIIRVGNGPLRRITPPNLGRTSESPRRDNSVIAASDQSPVPIPEMDDVSRAIPIPGLDSMVLNSSGADRRETGSPGESSAVDSASVMKPDTNDAQNGPGFNFPSLPPSLNGAASQAAQGIRSDVDRAGRELGTRASNQFNAALGQAGNALESAAADARSTIRIPPPPTRTSPFTQAQAPQFTGSDPTGEMARPRAGGPSTEPTNTRDNSWRDLMGSPSNVTAGETNAPNPFANRTSAPQANPNDPVANRQGASGLAPNDTFGRLPSGLGPPTASDDRASIYADRNSRAAGSGYTQGGYPQSEPSPFDRPAAGSPDASQSSRLQYDPASMAQGTSNGAYGQGGASPYDPRSSYANNREQPLASTRMNPDSRLTAAQIAAGAWSIDAYGRPVDRDGRLLLAANPNPAPSVYEQSSAQPLGPYSDRGYNSLGQLDPNSAAADLQARARQNQLAYDQSQRQLSAANSNFAPEPTSSRDLALRRGEVGSSDARLGQTSIDPPVLADRRALGAAEDSVLRKQQVAAQPLFNGLLLISVVANVYLIFWLKNLRLQFHGLVAAKRLANSNTPAA